MSVLVLFLLLIIESRIDSTRFTVNNNTMGQARCAPDSGHTTRVQRISRLFTRV